MCIARGWMNGQIIGQFWPFVVWSSLTTPRRHKDFPYGDTDPPWSRAARQAWYDTFLSWLCLSVAPLPPPPQFYFGHECRDTLYTGTVNKGRHCLFLVVWCSFTSPRRHRDLLYGDPSTQESYLPCLIKELPQTLVVWGGFYVS